MLQRAAGAGMPRCSPHNRLSGTRDHFGSMAETPRFRTASVYGPETLKSLPPATTNRARVAVHRFEYRFKRMGIVLHVAVEKNHYFPGSQRGAKRFGGVIVERLISGVWMTVHGNRLRIVSVTDCSTRPELMSSTSHARSGEIVLMCEAFERVHRGC